MLNKTVAPSAVLLSPLVLGLAVVLSFLLSSHMGITHCLGSVLVVVVGWWSLWLWYSMGFQAPIWVSALTICLSLSIAMVAKMGMLNVVVAFTGTAIYFVAWLWHVFHIKRATRNRGVLLSSLAAIIFISSAVVAKDVYTCANLPLTETHLSLDEQLRVAAENDQKDRYSGCFILNAKRDEARLAWILNLVAEGKQLSAAGHKNAGLLLLHGSKPLHFKNAVYHLTLASAAKQPGAEELRQAAVDRLLLSTGQQQRYGTQLYYR